MKNMNKIEFVVCGSIGKGDIYVVTSDGHLAKILVGRIQKALNDAGIDNGYNKYSSTIDTKNGNKIHIYKKDTLKYSHGKTPNTTIYHFASNRANWLDSKSESIYETY